jgi:serine/threonine-protein kinase
MLAKAIDLLRGLDDPEAYATLGDAFLARAQARRSFGKLDLEHPKEFDEAIDAYGKAPYASSLVRRAEAQLARYEYLDSVGRSTLDLLKAGREDCERALKLDPKSLDAALALARLEREIASRTPGGDVEKAFAAEFRALDELLQKFPPHASVYRARGSSRLRLGEHRLVSVGDPLPVLDGAHKDFAMALEINPKDASAYVLMGQALQFAARTYHQRGEDPLRFYAAAMSKFEEALKINPAEEEAYRLGAQARLHQALWCFDSVKSLSLDFTLALEQVDRSLEIRPRNAEAYYTRGMIRLNLATCSAHLSRDPTGELQGAIEEFRQALKINSNHMMAQRSLGLARQNLATYRQSKGEDMTREFESAILDLDRAVALHPLDGENHRWRGLAYQNLALCRKKSGGDFESMFRKSVEDLTKAIGTNPTDVEAHFYRGVSYGHLCLSAGDASCREPAIRDFERCKQLNPNYIPRVQEPLRRLRQHE